MNKQRKRPLEEPLSMWYFVVPKWGVLGKILDNTFISKLYIWLLIVPAWVKFSEQLPEYFEIGLTSDGSPVIVTLATPFNWYLYYFAAVLFFVSYCIYLLSCPKFLRTYGSPSKVLDSGVTPFTLMDNVNDYLLIRFVDVPYYYSVDGEAFRRIFSYFGGVANTILGEWHDTGEVQDWRFFRSVGLPKRDQLHPEKFVIADRYGSQETVSEEQFIIQVSWELLKLQERDHTSIRILVALLVLSGGIFAIIPSIQGLGFVIESML